MQLPRILTIVLIIALFIGCSSTDNDDDINFAELLKASKYSRAEIARWRSDVLPNLLIEFKQGDAMKWYDNQSILIKDERTPKPILEKLIADDALTVEGRAFLAQQGMIYKTLATFNGNNREDWQNARIFLMRLDAETQDQCIYELIRRMQYGPKYKKEDVTTLKGEAKGNKTTIQKNLESSFIQYNQQLNDILKASTLSKDLQIQKAFWASQELVIIGKRAIDQLLFNSKLVTSGFFSDMVFNTLAQMGEDAVPSLIQELKKTDKLYTAEMIFFHKRKLILCLGNLYMNYNYEYEDDSDVEYKSVKLKKKTIRDKLKYSKNAVKAITIQLRDYRADNEYLEYQFRLEIIYALRKIGEISACVPLVELWKKCVDDEDMITEIRIGLIDISGRKLKTLKKWQQYTDTLTDPEDFK